EYVLNGGNPTSGTDKAQVSAYPVGTAPDVNWRGYAFDFQNNVSPNGAIEYKSSVFNGALKGKLLVVRYSQHDDSITLTPGTTKDIVSSKEGASITGFSGFIDPLDITENVKNGNIYVSEYGGSKITLLRPHTGTTTVTAQKINNTEASSVSNLSNQFPSCDDTVAVMTSTENTVLQITDGSEKSKVTPNPFEKRFNIEFPAKYEGDFTLQIIDPSGKTFDIGKRRVKAGGSNISVDISKFSFKPGIYFLKVQSDSKTEIIKLVKQ
ncbi:MAG TPA: T9SS type A sorting domain-containing protein, partial [Segetibacter sp.]|nr:T9SS type A sorting domain-containing protein [Segetibacter sp.]